MSRPSSWKGIIVTTHYQVGVLTRQLTAQGRQDIALVRLALEHVRRHDDQVRAIKRGGSIDLEGCQLVFVRAKSSVSHYAMALNLRTPEGRLVAIIYRFRSDDPWHDPPVYRAVWP